MRATQQSAMLTARALLPQGYAHDLLQSVIDNAASESDCDALFRTLVLDEQWGVSDAAALYNIASGFLAVGWRELQHLTKAEHDANERWSSAVATRAAREATR